jgi:hypothetical protein
MFINLVQQNVIYNAYEYFEEFENCGIGLGIGNCYQNNNNNTFVLCCTNSRYGNGNRCLRNDMENPYNLFQLFRPRVEHYINLKVIIKGKYFI